MAIVRTVNFTIDEATRSGGALKVVWTVGNDQRQIVADASGLREMVLDQRPASEDALLIALRLAQSAGGLSSATFDGLPGNYRITLEKL